MNYLSRKEFEWLIHNTWTADEAKRILTYPRPTAGAARELRDRGLEATEPMLRYLVRKEIVNPKLHASGDRKWTAKDIDVVAKHVSPSTFAVYCEVLGVTCYKYLKAMKDEYDATVEEYGADAVEEVLLSWREDFRYVLQRQFDFVTGRALISFRVHPELIARLEAMSQATRKEKKRS